MSEVPLTKTGEETSKKAGKTVLIAFDGSEYAKNAMRFYADTMYVPDDNVVVVYCVELGDVITTAHISLDNQAFKELVQREIDNIKEKLIEFAKYMREIKLNGSVRSTHASSPGVGVINMADELNADLVVTGSRGHGRIRRTFIGTVSDYILHHSSVPVMIVSHHKDKHKHHKNDQNPHNEV